MNTQAPTEATTPPDVPDDISEATRDALGLTAEERATLSAEELGVLADMPRAYARGTTHSILSATRVMEAAERSTPVGKTADWRGAMECPSSDNLRQIGSI